MTATVSIAKNIMCSMVVALPVDQLGPGWQYGQ